MNTRNHQRRPIAGKQTRDDLKTFLTKRLRGGYLFSRRRLFGVALLFLFLFLFLSAGCIQPRPFEAKGRSGFPDYQTEIFIINGLAETVSVIDCETLTIHHDVMKTGLWPNHIVFKDGQGFLTNSGDNTIVAFNEDSLVTENEIDLGKNSNPWMVAFRPDSYTGYVPNFVAGDVAVIDTAEKKVKKRIAVGMGPEGAAVLGNKVYIGNTAWDYEIFDFRQGTVSVIDMNSNTVIKTIHTDKNPQSLIAFPDLNEVHVVCTGKNGGPGSDDGKINIIDASTDEIVHTIAIGGSPGWSGHGLDSAKDTVYLMGVGGVQAYNIKTRQTIYSSQNYLIPGKDPENDFFSGLAVDPVYKQIFICNFTYDKILVLDLETKKIKKEISGSDGAQIAVFHSQQ